MGVLSTLLSKKFSQKTRFRGQALFSTGHVEILNGTAWDVLAGAEGSGRYTVALHRESNDLQVSCSCPYYEDTGLCKHLWAAILQADANGLLLGGGITERLKMVELAPIEDEEFDDDDLIDDEEEDFDEGFRLTPPPTSPRAASPKRAAGPPPPPPLPAWQRKLAPLASRVVYTPKADDWPAGRRLLYWVNPTSSAGSNGVVLEVLAQDKKLNGDWAKPKSSRISVDVMRRLNDREDRAILAALLGARSQYDYLGTQLESVQQLTSPLCDVLFPRLCATGRCGLRSASGDDWTPLRWDDGEPWEPVFRIRRGKSGWAFECSFRRGNQTMPLSEPLLMTPGLLFTHDQVARWEEKGALQWAAFLRSQGSVEAPEKDGHDFLTHLLNMPGLPPLEVPPELAYERVVRSPQLRIYIESVQHYQTSRKLVASVSFIYDGVVVSRDDQRLGIYDARQRRLLVRDSAAEQAALDRIASLRLRTYRSWQNELTSWEIAPTRLSGIVSQLLQEGWLVEAEGKLFRQQSGLRMEVGSGIDWFELSGQADFGTAHAALPELLKALRRGERTVLLNDGSYGMISEDWLSRLQMIAGCGSPQTNHVRFERNQAGLLDVLLAEQPEVLVDEVFERARRQLREFDGVRAIEQPAGVNGELRGYQREGLGWMQFLEGFGFGGCLADDMGVGKTLQVLAMLEGRRASGENGAAAGPNGAAPACDGANSADHGATSGAPDGAVSNGAAKRPSLAVVPRSLIFNWIEEAARFTPKLRLKDHTGGVRTTEDFRDYDLILTTYGTLQRDAVALKDIEFEYVILDEAQAIKNAETKSAKAARLLKANHKLALSGTPVENHLGELWSLFEFLNPGMLGSSWLNKKNLQALRNPDEATRRTLARALRPFILRRTKEQVAAELPPKLEQTLLCEVQGAQRRLYDELRDHYRRTLLGKVEQQGLARSKMHVLEALLRLRQAACHPGLIDEARAGESSAKLETLLPRLAEVLDEGHKALVFSQFTSLLAIVRRRLDANRTAYEYLDGKTRDRQACVERFQTDPQCRLFLISLKAGGLGLNLTAAEYVFLLDPWWNPAVESQAIDRAHRIGQDRPVFAYRLIAKDTVEEKILELQQSKRDLADAIITADNSVIGGLSREDLELLLS